MAKRDFFCGNAREILTPSRKPRQDNPSTRLLTSIHLGKREEPARVYRVVACLAAGGQALVCLAETREEALARARELSRNLPTGAGRLLLQGWLGCHVKGGWRNLKTTRQELPQPMVHRRRLLGRRRKEAQCRQA